MNSSLYDDDIKDEDIMADDPTGTLLRVEAYAILDDVDYYNEQRRYQTKELTDTLVRAEAHAILDDVDYHFEEVQLKEEKKEEEEELSKNNAAAAAGSKPNNNLFEQIMMSSFTFVKKEEENSTGNASEPKANPFEQMMDDFTLRVRVTRAEAAAALDDIDYNCQEFQLKKKQELSRMMNTFMNAMGGSKKKVSSNNNNVANAAAEPPVPDAVDQWMDRFMKTKEDELNNIDDKKNDDNTSRIERV